MQELGQADQSGTGTGDEGISRRLGPTVGLPFVGILHLVCGVLVRNFGKARRRLRQVAARAVKWKHGAALV
jgi:hypothetical protein